MASYHLPWLEELKLPEHELSSASSPETTNTGRGIFKAGERQRRKGRDTTEGVITAIISE